MIHSTTLKGGEMTAPALGVMYVSGHEFAPRSAPWLTPWLTLGFSLQQSPISVPMLLCSLQIPF